MDTAKSNVVFNMVEMSCQLALMLSQAKKGAFGSNFVSANFLSVYFFPTFLMVFSWTLCCACSFCSRPKYSVCRNPKKGAKFEVKFELCFIHYVSFSACSKFLTNVVHKFCAMV